MVCFVDSAMGTPSENPLHHRAPPAGTASENQVTIRSFESRDHEECRELFAQGMWQLANPAMKMTLPRFLRYAVCLSVLVVAIAMKYSFVVLPVYLVSVVVLSALLYVHIYMECYKFISYCLNTDLMDIKSSYMSDSSSHMWVAEWQGLSSRYGGRYTLGQSPTRRRRASKDVRFHGNAPNGNCQKTPSEISELFQGAWV